jgi:hypothetical protein
MWEFVSRYLCNILSFEKKTKKVIKERTYKRRRYRKRKR